jgi:hypothetical protein
VLAKGQQRGFPQVQPWTVRMVKSIYLRLDEKRRSVSRGRPEPAKRDTGGRYAKEGCFIATAIYGDYDAPEVRDLRAYRDRTLLKSFLGRLFVRMYYLFSPMLAEAVGKSEGTKIFLRRFFAKFVIPRIREK